MKLNWFGRSFIDFLWVMAAYTSGYLAAHADYEMQSGRSSWPYGGAGIILILAAVVRSCARNPKPKGEDSEP